MTNQRIWAADTFDKIAAFYESIKPIRGDKHGGKDVRPLGARRYTHDRIVKISDDCYALSDGWNEGDPIFGYLPLGKGKPDGTELEFYAPIVWRRHPDGTETIKLRNASGYGAHTGRYKFLHGHTPRGMGCRVDNGRQYIVLSTGGRYFLAKGMTEPKVSYDARAAAIATGRHPYGGKRILEDDNASIVLRRDADRWTLISHGGNLVEPRRPRTVVDHDVKGAMKEQIETFRAWVHIVAPMLGITRTNLYEYQVVIAEWQKANNAKSGRGWGDFRHRVDADIARKIVADPEHPLRTAMAAFAIYEADLGRVCEDATDVTDLKSRFNRWINKALGLTKTVTE